MAALAFVSAACGDDDTSSTDTTPGTTDNGTTPDTPPDSTDDTTPITTADTPVATDGPVTAATEPTTLATEAEDAPKRIVSLSPTHTEILFAIGAGDQVIAVDSLSNYPEEASAVLTD
ncbi:MAG: hypothetical protein M3408_07585, partial [Actinomycetota bacterium]|nr:hypothetical protein [Actinomycetota bacterium]